MTQSFNADKTSGNPTIRGARGLYSAEPGSLFRKSCLGAGTNVPYAPIAPGGAENSPAFGPTSTRRGCLRALAQPTVPDGLRQARSLGEGLLQCCGHALILTPLCPIAKSMLRRLCNVCA